MSEKVSIGTKKQTNKESNNRSVKYCRTGCKLTIINQSSEVDLIKDHRNNSFLKIQLSVRLYRSLVSIRIFNKTVKIQLIFVFCRAYIFYQRVLIAGEKKHRLILQAELLQVRCYLFISLYMLYLF